MIIARLVCDFLMVIAAAYWFGRWQKDDKAGWFAFTLLSLCYIQSARMIP